MRAGTLPASRAFYPAAALYAAAAVPASALAMCCQAGMPVALGNPLGHAHEMLFGYALAVVAGNQLGALRTAHLAAMLLLWAAARLAFLLAPASAVTGAFNALFALVLAVQVVPRLSRSAKKVRNHALPLVLATLCAAAFAWQWASRAAGVPQALVLGAVVAFAMLLAFMGGRIIAPAVAGAFYRKGERLDARVQPRIEAALLLACAAALVTLAHAPAVAAASLGLAGALVAARMVRWRLWRVRERLDLLCLCAGYLWLAAGLIGLAASLHWRARETAAMHLVTVGALGTMSFNVMALSWLRSARRSAQGSQAIVLGTVMLSGAAVARVLGAFYGVPWLLAAAACWSAAFVVLLALFLRTSRGRPA